MIQIPCIRSLLLNKPDGGPSNPPPSAHTLQTDHVSFAFCGTAVHTLETKSRSVGSGRAKTHSTNGQARKGLAALARNQKERRALDTNTDVCARTHIFLALAFRCKGQSLDAKWARSFWEHEREREVGAKTVACLVLLCCLGGGGRGRRRCSARCGQRLGIAFGSCRSPLASPLCVLSERREGEVFLGARRCAGRGWWWSKDGEEGLVKTKKTTNNA